MIMTNVDVLSCKLYLLQLMLIPLKREPLWRDRWVVDLGGGRASSVHRLAGSSELEPCITTLYSVSHTATTPGRGVEGMELDLVVYLEVVVGCRRWVRWRGWSWTWWCF
jgi:hypothetical protein